jgi:hypothetical protein
MRATSRPPGAYLKWLMAQVGPLLPVLPHKRDHLPSALKMLWDIGEGSLVTPVHKARVFLVGWEHSRPPRDPSDALSELLAAAVADLGRPGITDHPVEPSPM